ncbi:glycosyltransferase family 1 protein [Selenomonas ruminantium]|uniref:glycosyltransferase family 4 protein n=1 Tax=Selenomonas ruminantium TaxID=971 RepID=UPI0026E97787|nr:glycosyltransferase family 1 protein [Selenomonas ruminantium]
MGKIIAVDGNLMCGKRTGMGTAAYNIVRQWHPDSSIRVILYVPEKLESDYMQELQANGIEIKILGKFNYAKWEQKILPFAVDADRADVLWSPYNTAPLRIKAKKVMTINDVIYMKASWIETPTLYKKAGLFYRRLVVPRAAKGAAKIITISEYARQEIGQMFPYVQDKMDVIYDSASKDTTALDDQERDAFFRKHSIRNNYILAFGSLEKRKNVLRVIKAYEQLPEQIRENHQLVLFGFRGYEGSDIEKYLQENGQGLDIVVLDFVSDKEKNTLYQNCECFVFPSTSEGFGIPVLEAYANHALVITSNTTSLPEVAGDAAVLVDPYNIEEISQALQEVLLWDVQKKITQKDKADRQLSKFDWKKTAERVLNVLLES